ncbi:MAG: FHA domain-containing protein [Verrucomicrobiae bacterium]|nr:FHA domain-containing protein [Verrucomicrobiae bacterium]
MIVVDTSNPARAKTIEAGKEAVRAFLTGLPKQDSVAICGLARDLEIVVPFGSSPEDAMAGVTSLKADGDASKTTLIYQNLREAVRRLSPRDEPRKAVLLITDGKDETPDGPAAQEIEKNKLVEMARNEGVVLHSFGYAESLDDQRYFGALKELASRTDGLFFPASVRSKELPKGTVGLLRGVMHGAGVAHVDVSKLEKTAPITITAKTAAGNEAVIKVPGEDVEKAVPPASGPEEETVKTPEELAKEKAEADADAATRAEEESKAEEARKAKEKQDREAAEREKQKRLWIIVGASVLLALLLAALLMVRSSRKRATEEQARLSAEAERAAEDARVAEETRLAAERTKKAEAKPLAWLEMCDAQQTRHPVTIPSLKIGRGQHNDFVLRNDSVSGNHCVLNRSREGAWSITDLNSGNGVILNGVQIHQAALRHGDTIELGELKMRFMLHG